MKRSTALIPLSRDHHHALVIAARLTRATPETAAAAREAFLEYWEQAGRRHFREEEEILLPAYAAHGDPHHQTVARVLCEHVDIRARADALARAPEPAVDALQDLGSALATHVRLEERGLFPLIEQTLPEADLERLAALLAD
jgi:hemerythrin-like domain-containing protein